MKLPIMAVREPRFPCSQQPFLVGRPASKAIIDLDVDWVALPQIDGTANNVLDQNGFIEVGLFCNRCVHSSVADSSEFGHPEGTSVYVTVVNEKHRVRLVSITQTEPYLEGLFEWVETTGRVEEAQSRTISELTSKLLSHQPECVSEAFLMYKETLTPTELVSFITPLTDVDDATQMAIFREIDEGVQAQLLIDALEALIAKRPYGVQSELR